MIYHPYESSTVKTQRRAVSVPVSLANTTGNISSAIAAQLRLAIENGLLKSGDRLAASRTLAKEIGVSRGTALVAIEVLLAEGLLETRPGSGTFVSAEAHNFYAPPPMVRVPHPEGVMRIVPDVDKNVTARINSQPCRPSTESFPVAAWRRATSFAASRRPDDNYGDPAGDLSLRKSIAAYLRRARGFEADPSQILISNGAIHALYLLSRLYLGDDSAVAFEDPGYPLARQIFELAGACIVPIGVDDDGMRTETLPGNAGNMKCVYVTPSNQFPMGSRLTFQRRQQLLAWAAENRVLVIEDDYDGEFRFDVAPLPPLAAMSSTRQVVYLGTFSKTMFPELRIGFAVAPEELVAELADLRTLTDYQTNTLTQRALAKFIDDGDYERHVHRMRRTYASRRRTLNEAIEESGLPATLSGIDCGLNGLIKLETANSAAAISEDALRRDLFVVPLSRYCRRTHADDGFVFGYGALSEDEIREAIEILGECAE